MAIVAVSQLKPGEKLDQNVHTSLGGVLFNKGKVITLREIEILQAFLVPSVSVESKGRIEDQGKAEEIKPGDEVNPIPHPFHAEYDKMLALLKKGFSLANSSHPVPMLDIRTQLEALIAQIDYYNILTFAPKNANKHEYMYHNGIMVALTSYLLAKWHSLPPKDLMQIALAGLFHDIGNMKVDPAILNKPGKLTADEAEEVRKHTIYGYNILKNVPALNEGVKLAALQHHEKMDGTGYPLGVGDGKIHTYARIVAIADVFHAMTSSRSYKDASSPYLVLEQIFSESFGKLDPVLVQTFIHRVTQFHNGTVVRLSDNRVGEIIFSDRANPTRPWVNVDGTIVNLTIERQFFIQDVIKA